MEAYKIYIFSALGTDNEIQLWDFETANMPTIFQKIEQYEAELSYYRKDSFINKINAAAGISYIPYNQDVLYLLTESFRYYQKTTVFNILMKPVQQQYLEVGKKLTFIQRFFAKKNIDMNQLKIKDSGIMLARKGMQLDLGGIAKGFIVDQVAHLLQKNNVQKGLVNFGGDIYVWNQTSERFNIGIKNPFVNEAEYLLVVAILNESISTSGVYERHHQNKLAFHHIIDPRTMQPSNSELISVSVIGKKTIETDVLATIFLILGIKQSLLFIEQNRLDINVIFITQAHETYCTSKLKKWIITSKVAITYL